MSKVLAVTLAKGQSQRIPNKNLKEICGKPLLGWTIEVVKKCELIDMYVVSSESYEVHNLAESYGVLTHSRSRSLATATTPSIKALQEAVTWADPRGEYEYIVLIPCTNPLKYSGDIDAGITLLREYGLDSVIGISPSEPVERTKVLKDHIFIRDTYPEPSDGIGQNLPKYWVRNGSFYAVRRSHINQGKLWGHEHSMGYLMPRERGVNIDTLLDFRIAEMLLKEREGLI